jgi:Flp pilus assembly protein TadG
MNLTGVSKCFDRLRNERGSAVVELAIVFPILLLLFVATAEIGRLFYTYTTLAKATKVAARYLSTQKDAESTDATIILNVKRRAARLAVCGYTDTCTGRDPVVPGLDTSEPDGALSEVTITLPDNSTLVTRYATVEFTGYTFAPVVLNVAGATGSTSNTFYFALRPATRMRYMH